MLFSCFWDHFGELFGLDLEEFFGFGAQVGGTWFFMDFGTPSGALPKSKSYCFVKDILQKSLKLLSPKKGVLQGVVGLHLGPKIHEKRDFGRSCKRCRF